MSEYEGRKVNRKINIEIYSSFIFVTDEITKETLAQFNLEEEYHYYDTLSGITSLIEALNPNCEVNIDNHC